MRLDSHGYSPTVLQMIAEASGRLHSFADATFAVNLAGVDISPRQVERIAAEIGTELVQQRDKKVALQRRRQLPVRVAAPPEVVAVEVDGGRLRTRAADSGPGVHDAQNKEDKIACLVNLKTEVYEQDPQPEPPESFLEPRRVQRLVQQMQGQAGDPLQEEERAEDSPKAGPKKAEPAEPKVGQKDRVRSCVASMAKSHSFGPMVAAEAQERGFFQAQRQAFLGDGAAYNWQIQRGYFPHFVAITDFLHVLCYIYKAAWAVGKEEGEKWSVYVGWLGACWQGRVKEVVEELRVWQGKIGKPPKGVEELQTNDPRRLVAEALSYLENNQARMEYPRYRKEGLPITSSLAESLVGEVNARVKSRQQFWNRPEGAEVILQLRAAVLSEDERLPRYFQQRPGCPYRRRKVA